MRKSWIFVSYQGGMLDSPTPLDLEELFDMLHHRCARHGVADLHFHNIRDDIVDGNAAKRKPDGTEHKPKRLALMMIDALETSCKKRFQPSASDNKKAFHAYNEKDVKGQLFQGPNEAFNRLKHLYTQCLEDGSDIKEYEAVLKLVFVFNILQPKIRTPIINLDPLGMRVINRFVIQGTEREAMTLAKAIEYGNSEYESAKAYQDDVVRVAAAAAPRVLSVVTHAGRGQDHYASQVASGAPLVCTGCGKPHLAKDCFTLHADKGEKARPPFKGPTQRDLYEVWQDSRRKNGLPLAMSLQ